MSDNKAHKTYLVTWEIEIDAESPRQAAARALKIQRDPESTALEFKVDGQSVDLLYYVCPNCGSEVVSHAGVDQWLVVDEFQCHTCGRSFRL